MGLTQVETGGVKDNSITSGKILDSEIETSDIKDGAVTTAKLANGAEDGKVLTSNNGSAPTFNTPTVEGTNVKSTGETDTTKFLRVDGDGTSSWQTPQGAGAVSTSADGLAPQLPSSHGGKFLKADATWEVPPYPSTVDTTANGLAPILPNPHGGKFLKADGTWQIPDYIANTDTTYNVFSESTDGLVPGTASGGGDSAKFLKGDATWAVPTVPDVTTSASGVVAALPSSDATTKFLRGDNTWVVPPDTDTTYSLADTTANGLVKILPTNGGSADTTKYLRGDNTWVTPPFLSLSGGTLSNGITINHASPAIRLTETDADPDYKITLHEGALIIQDITNSFASRFKVNTDGHIDIDGNLDVGAGLDVTGDITVSGTIDSVDLSTYEASGTSYLRSDADDVYEGGNLQIRTNSSSGQYWGFNLKWDSGWKYITTDGYGWAFRNGGTDGFEIRVADAAGTADQTATTKNFFFKSDGTLEIKNGGLDVTGDITLTDTGSIKLGGEDDLKIFHNGNNSWIQDNGNGNLILASNGNGVYITKGLAAETIAEFLTEDGCKLYYDGVTTPKLQTTSTGVDVTGNITVSGTVDGVDIAGLNSVAVRKILTDQDITERMDSGFYQASTPTTAEGWPVDMAATSWWHLLSNTHNATNSYFAQQLASPFFNNDNGVDVNGVYALYHRNTSNSGTRAWQKLYGSRCDAIPATNNTYDLGSDSLRWQDIYVAGNINVSGTVDGVDVAKLDALAYCNLNKTSVTENINVTYANRVPIEWDNKVYKSATYTHSTSTNPEKVTVTSAGLYMINVTIGYDNTGANRITAIAVLRKNGTELTETKSSTYSRSANFDVRALQINTVLQLAADDELDVYAWKDAANQADAVNTIAGECEFVITRLAGGVEAEA